MIVLDEQLLRASLRQEIKHWYRGSVMGLPELRPRTVIKDEEIPALLCSVRQPTFVTINVTDFWRRMAPHRKFGVVCVDLRADQVDKLPKLLRRLFATDPFATRRGRLGKIARVTRQHVHYYTADSWAVQLIPLA
jgi:hypothetical protein